MFSCTMGQPLVESVSVLGANTFVGFSWFLLPTKSWINTLHPNLVTQILKQKKEIFSNYDQSLKKARFAN